MSGFRADPKTVDLRCGDTEDNIENARYVIAHHDISLIVIRRWFRIDDDESCTPVEGLRDQPLYRSHRQG